MANIGDISYGLSIGAGQSVRRNAGDTAFEAYTPSAGGLTWGTSVAAGSGVALTLTSADLGGGNAFTSFVHTASGTLTACTTTQNTQSVSRTYTLTSGSVTDNFIGTLFSRTNVTTGAGGTLLAQGSVVNIAGTDTQTAGTLTPSYHLLKLDPSLRSTGSSIFVNVANSVATAPTNGHMYVLYGNTQTIAQTALKIDTGTSALNHVGLALTVLRSADTTTTGAITLNTFSSATQATGEAYGIRLWQNFNTSSTFNSTAVYCHVEANASSGLNTGFYIRNQNTSYSTTTTRRTGLILFQGGVGGTVMGIQTTTNVNSSTNGIVNFTLNNTQDGATVMQKIDLGTSTQGHTGLLVNVYNASTTAAGIKIAASTTGTGKGIEFTGVGATGHSNITFTDKISSAASGTQYGIYFVSSIMGNAGTAYGIYQETMQDSQNGGAGYGIYQNIVKNAAGTGSAYGWYVASIGSNAGGNNGRYFSLNNAQSGTGLEARSNDASEILFSRTGTHTTGTVADNFNLSYFKRTNIQNGAGGTLTATGSVLHLENVATQTAGTLTDTVPCLKLTQDNDSTGGHILFNRYLGVPLIDGTLYFDGTDFKYRAGGETKTITAV